GDLHVHRARVDLAQPGAVGADRPDAVYLVPGAFVTEHQQARVRRRELDVVEPVVAGVERLDLAGLDVHGVEAHRQPGGPAGFQAPFAVGEALAGARRGLP